MSRTTQGRALGLCRSYGARRRYAVTCAVARAGTRWSIESGVGGNDGRRDRSAPEHLRPWFRDAPHAGALTAPQVQHVISSRGDVRFSGPTRRTRRYRQTGGAALEDDGGSFPLSSCHSQFTKIGIKIISPTNQHVKTALDQRCNELLAGGWDKRRTVYDPPMPTRLACYRDGLAGNSAVGRSDGFQRLRGGRPCGRGVARGRLHRADSVPPRC